MHALNRQEVDGDLKEENARGGSHRKKCLRHKHSVNHMMLIPL